MAKKILLKKTAVPGKTPTLSGMDYGEVFLNYASGSTSTGKPNYLATAENNKGKVIYWYDSDYNEKRYANKNQVDQNFSNIEKTIEDNELVVAMAINQIVSSTGLDEDGNSTLAGGVSLTSAIETLQNEWGHQGPQGANGATGATGAQGRQGPQGAIGANGSQGRQGPQGATGATGGKGDRGYQGNQGRQGPQGAQGAKGDTGAASTVAGPRGNQGNQGPQGATGGKGDRGYQGNQGPQGAQGAKGNTGATGAQGNQGRQGPQGAQGAKGDTGAASTVAGPRGNQGNQGPQGATGGKGDKGDRGYQGNQGRQGPQGATGAASTVRGHQGNQGRQGPQGATGGKGDRGYQGNQGPKGAQGAKGDTGAASTVAGPRGYQGNQGPQGATGGKGDKGDRGYQGNQGRQGPQGATGAASTVRGHQGNQGRQGPKGAQGPKGDAATSSPFFNDEYGDMILDMILNRNVTQNYYNSLRSKANSENGHFYCEAYYNDTNEGGLPYVLKSIVAIEDANNFIINANIECIYPTTNFYNMNQYVRVKSDLTAEMLNATPLILIANGDGTKFLSNNGSYQEVKTTEFLNEEYGKIVYESLLNNTISSDNYNRLLNALNRVYLEEDSLVCYYCSEGQIIKFLLVKHDQGIYVYAHITSFMVPMVGNLVQILIKSDYTIETIYNDGVFLTCSGEGDRFLSNDGSYKTIDTSGAYIIDWINLNSPISAGTVTQQQYDELYNAIMSNKPIYISYGYSVENKANQLTPVTGSLNYGGYFLFIEFKIGTWGYSEAEYIQYGISPDLEYSLTHRFQLVTNDDIKVNAVGNIGTYRTGTSISSLYDYETYYINLTSNGSLSMDGTPSSEINGRSTTVFVYTSSSRTITIPTTGNYISMCGSSYTTKAGGWVEFNLTCVEGKWHIAMLEQQ